MFSLTGGSERSPTSKINCEYLLNASVGTKSARVTTVTATQESKNSLPWIFAITPTYKRLTQVVDLTSLCQTLQLVRNLVWILIEDSYLRSDTVTDLLRRCQVRSVHLIARNITRWNSPAGRGVAQRNAGLTWIRKHCHLFDNCNGSFYFMDDDNKYGLTLFEKIREVEFIGIWPVGYAGYLRFEGPVCIDNHIVEWNTYFDPQRNFPLDMAGFAVNLKLLLEYPDALFGYNPHSRFKAEGGWQETRFLENFVSRRDDPKVECLGSHKEVFVWHIKTGIGTGVKEEPLKEGLSTWKYDIKRI